MKKIKKLSQFDVIKSIRKPLPSSSKIIIDKKTKSKNRKNTKQFLREEKIDFRDLSA